MPKATLNIDSVSVSTNPTTDVQTVTLVMTYNGTHNLEEEIIQGQLLDIEIPSHAPPPQDKHKG